MSEYSYHKPVMLQEAVDGLNLKPNGVYVDVTFGGGGHSREILKRLEGGKLIAFDQDPAARANVPDDSRFILVDQNFRHLRNWLQVLGISQVDGVLADLGVSSHQFDTEDRGFSIRFDAPLDMRMGPSISRTAADVINTSDEAALTRILRSYGEVEQPHRIARVLINNRPVLTTGQLMELTKGFAQRGKEHKFYAQLFQALRIEVNGEMDALREMLLQTEHIIRPGGRLSVISYHSLEDRLVKDYMKTGNFDGTPQKDFFGNLIRPFKPLSSKPLLPSEEEIEVNTRARSAKLRVAERTSELTD